jgi:hypothetical protein
LARNLDNLGALAFVQVHSFASRTQRYIPQNSGLIPSADISTQTFFVEVFVGRERSRERNQDAAQAIR